MSSVYEEYRCKSVFNPGPYPDHWFWTHGSSSAYRGCGHACVYCDGRNSTYGMDEHFSSKIRVKVNAPEVFESELRKRYGQGKTLDSFGIEAGPPDIFKPTVFFSSGVSDAYQPAEEKYGLSRKLLGIARDYSLPVHIMTKSAMVLRDMDILREINSRAHCTVSFSIPSMDDTFSHLFEPGASSPGERFRAMSEISRAGIETGICMMPIVPFFSDSRESIVGTVREARSAGARFLLFGGMTLRDEQQQHFYRNLDREMPGESRNIRDLYRGQYSPPVRYMRKVTSHVIGAAREEGLPIYLERHLPDYRFSEAKKASTALFQLAYFHEILGGRNISTSGLLKAAREIENLRTDFISAMENGVIRTMGGIGPMAFSALEEYATTGKIEELEAFKKNS